VSPLRTRELIALLRHPALRPDDQVEIVWPPNSPQTTFKVGDFIACCEENAADEERKDGFWLGPEHELTFTLVSADGATTTLKMSDPLP
jgi:hypothetical protein